MNRYLLIALLLTVSNFAVSQSHYVSTSVLNLRSEPSTSSEVVNKLSYCDNLTLSEDQLHSGWTKVSIDNFEGYVSSDLIKKGKCNKSTYEYRIGAVCNDGTGSSATGRGACSHHGGVKYWKTKTKTNYKITDK